MKMIVSGIFFMLFFVAQSQTSVVKDIKSFGAKGDGKTNDQAAFQKAADYFNKRGGNGKLIISKGTYIVGKQSFTGGQPNKYAYTGEDVLRLTNIRNFTIKGSKGAILKYINNMRIGTFSPKTGEAYDHGNTPFTDPTYAAVPGYCIVIVNGRNIQISNLDLDGNIRNMIPGGIYGDQGRQLQHYGIFIMNSRNILIDKINAHHFGLDGIAVSNVKSDTADKIKITNSRFQYNARQGLSWVGGNDLYAKNCKFNHTGKVKFSSPPGAGLDIEAESGPVRNGVFDNCEFIDNNGLGMGADSGDSGDCTFNNCTFWGISYYSIWVRKPGFTFNRCNIYGCAVPVFISPDKKNATKFYDCHFEDNSYNGQLPYGVYLVETNDAKYTGFTNCTFVSNYKKLCWFSSIYSKEEKYQFDRCSFTINNGNLPNGDFVGLTRGMVLKNCTFKFTDPNAKKKKYNFGAENVPVNGDANGTKILYKE
jgi:hypothetical protein